MSEIVLVILIVIAFPIYTVIACKNKNIPFMSVKQTNALKGLAIILTYIHHTFLGYLGVALFLFISGYVTNKQVVLKKEKWSDHFWIKKIKRLFVPRLIVVFLFGFLAGRSLLDNCIESVWFVQEWFFATIVFNFAVFYIAKRAGKEPVKYVLGAEAAFIFICIAAKQQIMWYNTAFMFGLGVVFSYYEERLLEKLRRKLNRYIIFSMFFASSFFLVGSILRWQRLIFDSFTAFLFVLIVVVWVYKSGFYSQIFEFMGKYSWEFYLVHTRVIGIILNRVTKNNLLAFFISLMVSTIIAFALNKLLSIFYKISVRTFTRKIKS